MLRLTASGNETAFTELFHFYRNKIYTVAYKLTESEEASEEIVQDVFLKVWLKREGLNEIENFDSWLFIIARNTAYSFFRSIASKTVGSIPLNPDLITLQQEAADPLREKELQEILREAIESLPPQQKIVYRLSKEEGLKNDQISKQLNLSPETVKKHLQYAMKTIRSYCMSRMDLGLALLFIWRNS